MALPELEIIRMGVITCDLNESPNYYARLEMPKKSGEPPLFHQITKQAQNKWQKWATSENTTL